jgi:hypothetical protein
MKTQNPIYTVYSIKNLKTGTEYYGTTKNLTARWETHVGYLDVLNRHPNLGLQTAWNNDGASYFEFKVLMTDQYKYDASAVEKLLIASNPSCYNVRHKPGAAFHGRDVSRKASINKADQGVPQRFLSASQVRAIKRQKGKTLGYILAKQYNVSPSTISNIFHNRYEV